VIETSAMDPLCRAVEAAWKAGIVVVAAAGNAGRLNLVRNSGYGTILSPGNDPYIITAGAAKFTDEAKLSGPVIASYSSKGPTRFDHTVKPDLIAPGTRITSTSVANSYLWQTYPN